MRLAGIIRMAIASYRSVSPHSAARRTSWASVRMPAVAWTLASGDTTRDIAEAEQMLEARRHNIFKLKIGLRSVDADVAHVAAIKKALGDRASVRVDVNQAWSEPEARRGIPALEAAGVDLRAIIVEHRPASAVASPCPSWPMRHYMGRRMLSISRRGARPTYSL
ncbi:MAG: muconate cycloisomerase [Tardiphaga sp.]|nr:muconate cycloisomerase [Tardiphaga sp.]